MMREEKAIEVLGKRVRDALGTKPGYESETEPIAPRKEVQRRAVVAAMSAAQVQPVGRRTLAWAAAAAMVLAVLVLAALGVWTFRQRSIPRAGATSPAPLTFQVEGLAERGKVGKWLQAPNDRVLVIQFDRGSKLVLRKAASGRVVESTVRRVRIQLFHGKLTATIHRQGSTTWSIEAGPYLVTVKGTQFLVSWNLHQRALHLAVKRGKVLVTGPELDDGGITLGGGRELHVDGMTGSLSVQRSKAPAPVPSARPGQPDTASGFATANSPPGNVEHSPAGRTGEPRRTSRHSTSGNPAEDWKRLLARKKYAAAVRAAEQQGFGGLLKKLKLVNLWNLANACRFARHGTKAIRAFLSVRRRFKGSGRAGTAAFLLGRVYMELQGMPARAKQWFDTYLKEAPRGPLAEEALGRYIDASSRAGLRQDARRAAKTYLGRYKQGIFRTLAESVLSRGRSSLGRTRDRMEHK